MNNIKYVEVQGSACVALCGTNEEDDVSVEVDAELNAVDNLLTSPAGDAKVGD